MLMIQATALEIKQQNNTVGVISRTRYCFIFRMRLLIDVTEWNIPIFGTTTVSLNVGITNYVFSTLTRFGIT